MCSFVYLRLLFFFINNIYINFRIEECYSFGFCTLQLCYRNKTVILFEKRYFSIHKAVTIKNDKTDTCIFITEVMRKCVSFFQNVIPVLKVQWRTKLVVALALTILTYKGTKRNKFALSGFFFFTNILDIKNYINHNNSQTVERVWRHLPVKILSDVICNVTKIEIACI